MHLDIFDNVRFNNKTHKYFIDDIPLIPTTTFISTFQPVFDKDLVANKQAQKTGDSVDNILKKWKEKSDKALKKGSAAHEYIQHRLLGNVVDLEPPYLECKVFDNFWRFKTEWDPVRVEYVIGDKDYKLGGVIDCLMYNRDKGYYQIVDWKTGKFTLNNQWENMHPPFAEFDNSYFIRYSMQLSCYQLILEKNLDIPLGPSQVVHFFSNGSDYQVVDMLNLSHRFKDILTT